MTPDWKRINAGRVRDGLFKSEDRDGFNGAFCFLLNGLPVKCIASDGMGWQHVSASIHRSTMTPSWSVMCQVKEIFWGLDEWVMQLHPPKTANINNHAGCLHLWRPVDGKIPLPQPEMVGILGVEPKQLTPEMALREYVKANSQKEAAI